MRTRVLSCLAVALAISFPAAASFHEIHVKEVFAGSPAHPNAQYILLQAYASGQEFVGGHQVSTFGPTGASTGTFPFSIGTILPNGNDQMTILLATPDAAAIFNVTADLAMTAVLDPEGGKVCWDGATPADCFAWGSYSGSATGVGTPYNATGGLIPGYAARRRLDICLTPGGHESCDDTDDSANDFYTAVPSPITNPGVAGATPAATCGNGTLEGLEGCDDNDTNSGDGCSATCHPEPVTLVPSTMQVDPTFALVAGNGVFEPGESVRLVTRWTNDGSDIDLTGQIVNFTGPTTASPPFPAYRISDGASDYGTLTTTQSGTCNKAVSDCYLVHAEATNRPAQHWDASVDEILSNGGLQTWPIHIGESFADVTTAHQFYAFIENLFHNRVTGGCAGGNYCPTNPVTRAQMAVFLLKAKYGFAHVPPNCTGTRFDDVPCTGGAFDPWIEELAALQITGGCGGTLYCPDNPVTRGQMAVFLLKALEGSTYNPPDCAGIFDDVPCTPGVGFSDWIEELSARNITGGCQASPPLYCPTNPNNRGQMAVFLVKTFQLLLYGIPLPI